MYRGMFESRSGLEGTEGCEEEEEERAPDDMCVFLSPETGHLNHNTFPIFSDNVVFFVFFYFSTSRRPWGGKGFIEKIVKYIYIYIYCCGKLLQL